MYTMISAVLERAVALGIQWLVTPEEIPTFAATLRYGVPSAAMLPPVRDGRLSRQLAVRLWKAVGGEPATVAEVKAWLHEQPVTAWPELLDLTSFEFEALIDFVGIGLVIEEQQAEEWARVSVPGLDASKAGAMQVLGVRLFGLLQDGQVWLVATEQQAAVRQAVDRGFEFVRRGVEAYEVWLVSPEEDLSDQ